MPSQESNSSPRHNPQITVNSGNGVDLPNVAFPDSSIFNTMSSSERTLMPPPPSTLRKPRIPSFALYGDDSTNSSERVRTSPRSKGPVRPYQSISSRDDSIRLSSIYSSQRGSVDSLRSNAPATSISPFDDSMMPSTVCSSDDGQVNTQTVAGKYNITPSAGLLIYPEDVEKDDWLHNPDPNEKDHLRCDLWNKRGLVNLGGLILITAGTLMLFIGYPVLTFLKHEIGILSSTCDKDPDCLSDSFPLLVNQRTGLIDPDTPNSAKMKTAHDGTPMKLVFSDEFNKAGRTFYPGDDPYFEAVDIWYGVTEDLEWYDPDAVTTEKGTLNLRFDAFQSHNLNYRSGMVQSWNKLCFKGGRMEASISLPGRGDTEGFWPGFWAMGNLGRPGYSATTDGLWPYSYHDKCDVGITKNQSSLDGISLLPGMRLPACTCSKEEHPSPGNSRSAPEIDAVEASVGFMGPGRYGGATGTASQSFQAAPFDIWYQPDYSYVEVYDNQQTSMNPYRGGAYQEALSGLSWLNNAWYDGKAYQKYGFEYNPGDTGDIAWFIGDQYTWKMDHRAIRPNGNIGQRTIPQEPMALVMNFGISNSFATIFMANLAKLMPATMRFDYVRIYQDPSKVQVTCDPPGYPTTEYIKNHPKAYYNPNVTLWKNAGYSWPKNSFVDECEVTT